MTKALVKKENNLPLNYVEVVGYLPDSASGAKRLLVKAREQHFLLSEVVIPQPLGGLETLIFPCDENGHVDRWLEVGGGKGIHLQEALAGMEQDLDAVFAFKAHWEEDQEDDLD